MNYRRVFVPGASYFFTLTLQDRRSDLLIRKIKELRMAFQPVMEAYPFAIDGIVVLPEHIHMSMTLPPDDINYSQRISFIKSAFSRQIELVEFMNSSRKTKRERGVWQRRFWEHLIRDEQDYERHLDYIHYNPVKHGHVTICIAEVPFCIFTLLHRVFPSIAIISFRAVCSYFTHVTKHDLNSSGFNTAKTRAKVSFEAIPFSKG